MKLEFISCEVSYQGGWTDTKITAVPDKHDVNLIQAFIKHNDLRVLKWNITPNWTNHPTPSANVYYEIITTLSFAEFYEKWNNFEREYPEYFL